MSISPSSQVMPMLNLYIFEPFDIQKLRVMGLWLDFKKFSKSAITVFPSSKCTLSRYFDRFRMIVLGQKPAKINFFFP